MVVTIFVWQVEDIAAKLQDERRARQEEASAAAAEHGADQSHVADLTAQVAIF
jgi:hypothetical protein